MYLLDKFEDAFDVSDNASYTCVVEEYIYLSSCVVFSFTAKFVLYAALIMAAVREWIVLVGGSYTASDTNSWWVSEGLPWVLKKDISSIYCEALFNRLGQLVRVSDDCFTLACTLLRR